VARDSREPNDQPRVAGKVPYAVRDSKGRFRDVQTYERTDRVVL